MPLYGLSHMATSGLWQVESYEANITQSIGVRNKLIIPLDSGVIMRTIRPTPIVSTTVRNWVKVHTMLPSPITSVDRKRCEKETETGLVHTKNSTDTTQGLC